MMVQVKAKRSKHYQGKGEEKGKRRKRKWKNWKGCCTAQGARYRQRKEAENNQARRQAAET
jgi:hypothetical protein